MYPQVFGKYVLERELARGGMARVVLATLRGAGGFEKKLVVKQIRDELAYDGEWVRRFVEEAKTTVSLSHPNIVPVYELGVEQGTYFLAMELVDGVTVAELLRATSRPLTPEEGAYVGVEVCRALDYAHRRMDVVHRDVTPRNVMVDEEGQVKVIDFGIAAPSEVAGHEVFGSPGHMPPEQIAGASLGPATDVFAVAVMLMEAWSGKPPFRRKTPAECVAAMRAPHPRPSDAGARLVPLDEIIGRAMQLDPAARPQGADELGKALRKFLSGTDTGDVARALGARVREARENRAGREEAKGDAPRARMPSVGDAATRTFAARQEVQSAPRRSERPPRLGLPTPATPVMPIDVGMGTRRLPPSTPPPPLPASEAPVDVIETVATASLERAAASPERSRALLLGLALAGALAAGAFALRTGRPGPGRPVERPAPSLASTSAPSPVAPADSRPPAVPPAILSNQASTSPTSEPPPATSAVASPVAEPSHLALFADPGTRIAIDGVPRGRCPIRDLEVAPGAHDVRFTFDPTGESRGERLTLRAGDRVTLRADFSSAIPTVRIER